MESLSALSLLPILTILVLAVTTRRTLFAMVAGLTVGAALMAGANDGFVNSWFNYFYQSMSNESAQWICLVVAMFGMLIVLFERSNAVKDFGYWAGKFVKTKKQSLFATAILGIVIFLDDYLNNLAVGTTM
jgi:Na+/H+ antiporter NhaC